MTNEKITWPTGFDPARCPVFVRNEIQIASDVARKIGDQEFIIPLRLASFEAPFLIAHAQYIASTDDGREACAVDGIVEHLLTDVYRQKRYFDFGISTESAGRHLNSGLIANKETYGARCTVYDTYEITLVS